MKKYFCKMLLIAVAVMTVASLASCNKDEKDTPKTPEPEQKIPHVKYLAKFGEDLFEYAEITVTINCNDKDTVFKMDETTKVADINLEQLDMAISERPISKAGRVLQVPPVMVSQRPIKITTNIIFTEEGKQKIAQATNDDLVNFAAFLDYGVCDQNGKYISTEQESFVLVAAGVHVPKLEEFIAQNCVNKHFNCIFK